MRDNPMDKATVIERLRASSRDPADAAMVEALARNWGVPTTITEADYDAAMATARGLLTRSDDRPCPCGSDKPSRWYRDARQIELFRGCDDCAPAKLSRYRPEVLTDPNYEASEPIEPEIDDTDSMDALNRIGK